MAKSVLKRRSASAPAVDLDAKLAVIAVMTIEQLRSLWRERRGQEAPAAFSRDLISRALAYQLQEQVFGSLSPRLRKLLAASGGGGPPARRVKVGSVIVREYQGALHEVLVVPDGFCWREEVFASLSTIARRITGTRWNGPRFFGLRDVEAPIPAAAPPTVGVRPTSRSGSIRARPPAHHVGGAA